MSKQELKSFCKHTLPIVACLAIFDAVCLVVAIMGNKSDTSLAVGAIMIITNIIVIAMVK